MRRRALLLLLPLLLLLQVHVPSVFAADIPSPKGDIYVQDFAGVLEANEKEELNELGRYMDDHTGAQIAVLTVDSLEDLTVEEYALEAFRKYGLGSSKENNGVLFLLAMNDRKMRIEVGYGLEGPLPDGKVGRILDSYALPYLQEDNPGAAVLNTYKQLFNEVSEEYGLEKQTDAEGMNYDKEAGPSPLTIIIWVLIFLGLIFLDYRFLGGAFTLTLLRMLAAMMNNGGRGGGGPRSGGGGSSGGGGASRGW